MVAQLSRDQTTRKRFGVEDAEGAAGSDGGDGAAELEDFDVALEGALLGWHGVALFDDGDAVEDAAIDDGAEELEVFGVGPDEGLGGAGGAAEVEALGGYVGVVPDLLGQHAADGAEAFDGGDEAG